MIFGQRRERHNKCSAHTQALAETKADRIERFKKFFQRSTGLGSNVPNPRTVEVHLEAVAMDEVRDADDFILRDDGTVEGVLKGNNLGR